jgi:adenylyltransferase/sulfurtransferase
MGPNMKEITVKELKNKIDNEEDIQLIDIRETNEREFTNIGGDHIPMGTITQKLEDIARDKDVVFYCRSGSRSGQVVNYLEVQYGLQNLFNLRGGILAWSDEIDPSIKKY